MDNEDNNNAKMADTLTTFMSFELKDKLIKIAEKDSVGVVVMQEFRNDEPNNSDFTNLANKLYWLDRLFQIRK